MFVRNLLQAGDHVTIVPAGIRITLQYDSNGAIERAYVGYNDDKVQNPEILSLLLSTQEIPARLPINKGTSFVYGCLYTGEVYTVEGRFDEAVETVCVNKYIEDPLKFHFFAGHLQSHALAVSSPTAISRWLKSAGFNILPAYLAPKQISEENFVSMLNLSGYPFNYPRIMSYIVFRSGNYIFENTGVRQLVIKNINCTIPYEIYDGSVLAEITSSNSETITTTYADVVNYNIHKGSIVYINDDNQILDCFNFSGQKLEEYSRTITCAYCGSVIEVPSKSVKFSCSNEHCVSRMYSKVSRMLSKLGLPPIDIEEFRTLGKSSNNVVAIFDVFNIDKYKDISLEVDLPALLDAVVPQTIVTRVSDWSIFCSRCNNSVESVLYYLRNPGRILKELDLEPAIYRKLTLWLEDNENLLDVEGMIDNPHIKVLTTGRRFEGAPIFRGKSIYVTGKFAHGSFEDIKAILSSYSATVYDKFNTAVDCVVIGDFHEDTNGRAIQKARQMNIPIFEERNFFREYDIDTDLASIR